MDEQFKAFTSASEHLAALHVVITPLLAAARHMENYRHPCGMFPQAGYLPCCFRLWLMRFVTLGTCPGEYRETLFSATADRVNFENKDCEVFGGLLILFIFWGFLTVAAGLALDTCLGGLSFSEGPPPRRCWLLLCGSLLLSFLDAH